MGTNDTIIVSIAITTYNHEEFLAQCLDSVLQQDHNYRYEIIICDDCSTDTTASIIKSYHERYPEIIRPYFNKKNEGVSKNSLHGLYQCTGRYIATLDGDDYWTDPRKIVTQISFLESHPEYVLSCHRYRKIDHANTVVDDPNEALFEKKEAGFEFDQELYFEHWITQTLTVVFRRDALPTQASLTTYRYCWDTELFWLILKNGKGFAHNFFGGIYRVHAGGAWNGNTELRKNSMMYLITGELLARDRKNPVLIKTHIHYYYSLWYNPLRLENSKLLELFSVAQKNFTIICDDEWGEEIYKALNLQPLSPFIGVRVYNDDFIKLASAPNSYLTKPLCFLKPSESKHPLFLVPPSMEKEYPVALLGDAIELHFIAYTSEHEARQKWDERVKRINWKNLFLKMDGSREPDNHNQIAAFGAIRHPYTNKVCFQSAADSKRLPEYLKNHVTIVEDWVPEPAILYPLSLRSFNPIDWLNGTTEKHNATRPPQANIFAKNQDNKQHYVLRFDDHFFARFDDRNMHLLDSYFDTITLSYDATREVAIVNYDKSGLDHFRLSADNGIHSYQLETLINLKNKADRHALLLARGTQGHKLRIDFVPWHKIPDHDGTHLNVQGMELDIPKDFEWMHFDLSVAGDFELESLFEQIKSFCFYINPGEEARGMLEIVAVFVGSMERFEEMITNEQ